MRAPTKLLVGALASLASTAAANGFAVTEFDARVVGRGNAAAATDGDPSAIYYNVGGLAVADGTHVLIGGSVIDLFSRFDQDNGNSIASTTGPQIVPALFASKKLTPLLSAGIGFYTPFGSALSWPADAPTTDVLRAETLRTYFITPSLGLDVGRFVPGLTVGAGLDVVPATIEIEQDVFFGTDKGSAHLGGTALGIGARVGAMYRPSAFRQLSLGVMWRSHVVEDFSGTGNFAAPPPYRGQLPADGDISAAITLPQQVTVGVAYRPLPRLELELDGVWTNWRTFNRLDIHVPGPLTLTTIEAYEDTFTGRFGIEYTVPALGLGVRAGYIYDPTPIKAEYLTVQLPDIDRHEVTLGASKAFAARYAVHVGLLWVIPGSRKTATTANLPEDKGTFDVSAIVTSLSLAGRLGD